MLPCILKAEIFGLAFLGTCNINFRDICRNIVLRSVFSGGTICGM